MRRFDDWHSRLATHIAACRTQEIAYGRWDCMLFAADAVIAMTGTDLAADFRGRYTTLRGGLRVLKRAGFADQLALIDRLVGPRTGWMDARPGDVAAVMGEDGLPAVGIVQGAMIYVLGPVGGIALSSIDTAIAAWRID